MLEENRKKIIANYMDALPYMTEREQEILAAQAEAVAIFANERKKKIDEGEVIQDKEDKLHGSHKSIR